jgi:hypothetical protein
MHKAMSLGMGFAFIGSIIMQLSWMNLPEKECAEAQSSLP